MLNTKPIFNNNQQQSYFDITDVAESSNIINHTSTNQHPVHHRGGYNENNVKHIKNAEIIQNNNEPNNQVIEDKQKDVVVGDKQKDVVVSDKQKNVIVSDKQKDAIADKPKNVIVSDKQKNVVNEKNTSNSIKYDVLKNAYVIYDMSDVSVIGNNDIIKCIDSGVCVSHDIEKYIFSMYENVEYRFVHKTIFTGNIIMLMNLQNLIYDIVNRESFFKYDSDYKKRYINFYTALVNFIFEEEFDESYESYKTMVSYRFSQIVSLQYKILENKYECKINELKVLYNINNELTKQLNELNQKIEESFEQQTIMVEGDDVSSLDESSFDDMETLRTESENNDVIYGDDSCIDASNNLILKSVGSNSKKHSSAKYTII